MDEFETIKPTRHTASRITDQLREAQRAIEKAQDLIKGAEALMEQEGSNIGSQVLVSAGTGLADVKLSVSDIADRWTRITDKRYQEWLNG